jgi:eukaryotic-like serine/threonine-protein kinase
MADRLEAEMRIVLAEGLLSRDEAAALRQEALHARQSPLALLVERGRLSERTYRSLVALAFDDTSVANLDPSTWSATDPLPGAGRGDIPPFPVPAWDRYLSVRFLGQGGMGQVFLAVDPRLRREVAIKFVRGDNPEHVRRLIAEARTQARVNHEHVCKVHEVGDVEGRVYIAMQYIDGKPLGALAGELAMEQKVMLVRAAAEGLHEAHRAGIIHRDVKPSNIMVERGDDGELEPYVMDFGLARSVQEDNATLSGTVMGTPRYMAPEQMRGSVSALDRRADVYSLGATLYHLLAGQPPIPGDTLLEVMHNVATLEPRPLRALDPAIPADLEAIVLRCLEKDRAARYDSARALADDLGRFLDGEPVTARPVGAWYRLRKRLAKHRRLVMASALAAVVVMVAVIWAIQTRREASEREDLARQFTERVEHIEAMARYVALSRAHDIRGDRAAIRARMGELEGEIRRAGELAVGPGDYALGRGCLALGDDALAFEHLASAWRDGFREPRVAYALALALGHLYQQALRAAQRIESKELREARQRALERRYRDPALGFLAASRGAEVPSLEYVAALVAFYDGRLDEALRHVDAIGAGLPWFYEAPELRGDILFARAVALRDQGKPEQARRDFEAGRTAYAAAGAEGGSVPAVYESLGELEYAAMVMELYGQGDVKPAFDRGIAATAQALAILPDQYEALVLGARTRRSLAEYQVNHGKDAEDLLAAALRDAQRAVEVSPARPEARLEIAQILRQWGSMRGQHNQDPSEQLRKAIEAAGAIAPSDRDPVYFVNLGLIFKVWADYQDQVGADSRENRGKAIDAYTRALQLDDRITFAWINLGINDFMRASQPRAADPDGDLAQAIRALDRARSINPRHVVPYFYEGQIHEAMAQRQRARGGDPGPDLARALDAYKAGLAINPNLPQLHNGAGLVAMDQAKRAWDLGEDPAPLLDQARAAFERAIAAAPDQGFGYDNLGEVFAQRAWFARARGEDPSASVAAAVEALNRAIERIPDRPGFLADLGMTHAILAAYDLEHGRDPSPSLVRAASAIERALHINPGDAQSLLYLGETRGIVARLHARQGHGKVDDFEAVAQAFQQAIDRMPEDPDYRIAFGQFCRAWAEFQLGAGTDPAPALERGLKLADALLGTRPSWPDALVLRASLLLLRAQRAASPAERREQGVTAAEDLSKALSTNRMLENHWNSQLAQARAIAAGR